MVSYIVRRFAVGYLPRDLAPVEVDRRDTTVWRPDERQPLHFQWLSLLAVRAGDDAPDEVHVRLIRLRPDEAQRRHLSARENVEQSGLGIVRPAWPIGAGRGVRQHQRGARSVPDTGDRGCEQRADLVLRHQRLCLRAQLGRKVDQVVHRHALALERRRLGDERLRQAGLLAGNIRLLDRALLDRPHRLARPAVEDVEPALLGRLRHHWDVLAIDCDVCQNRRARDVEVPDSMVYELVVPSELARAQVGRH